MQAQLEFGFAVFARKRVALGFVDSVIGRPVATLRWQSALPGGSESMKGMSGMGDMQDSGGGRTKPAPSKKMQKQKESDLDSQKGMSGMSGM